MGRPLRELTPCASVRHRFGAELRTFRKQRGLSQTALGERVMHSGSTVSKIEKAERWPSREFAFLSDKVLHAQGSLKDLWLRAQAERTASELAVSTIGEPAQAPDARARLSRAIPHLDEGLGMSAADHEHPYRATDRIVADLLDLQEIVAGHREEARLRRSLDQTISLLIGDIEPISLATLQNAE
ncbi:helix-turn-helix transcriptional regulator [Streptomyces triculaminicus]|uniref:Helix-turn-helix transcriptional regulator n=2 Tax=Streptomyces TaxID=1883 RepID=A0A939FPV0_9ACTN|nr:helix-turn-helix transcriptional regulator [Streptomyces triculaminicus]QSY49195.1 helix-turn-helix transcriptional regulator [Streptomyces griseocarneus]